MWPLSSEWQDPFLPHVLGHLLGHLTENCTGHGFGGRLQREQHQSWWMAHVVIMQGLMISVSHN